LKIARQFRVEISVCISPEETGEPLGGRTAVGVVQPSLRDGISLFRNPTLESVGYFQVSVRETEDERLCC